MSFDNSASGGIGILGLLGVSFVVLKLCNVINWSWWWVTAPFWGPLSIIAGIGLFIFLVWAVLEAFAWMKADRNLKNLRDRLNESGKRNNLK